MLELQSSLCSGSNTNSIRKFRNNSVHFGFRPWDVNEDDRNRYSFVMDFARSSCHKLGFGALSIGCRTAKDAWDMASLILEEDGNLVNHVHNNFFFFLKTKSYERLT